MNRALQDERDYKGKARIEGVLDKRTAYAEVKVLGMCGASLGGGESSIMARTFLWKE